MPKSLDPIRVFIGVDPRQPLAATVLQNSISRHASVPVSITQLHLSQLPITVRGLTDFTYSRYIVPKLCGFKGWGVFMDADMIMRGDIVELMSLADKRAAVSVMQEQPRFEWPSLMVFNNALCEKLTDDYINNPENRVASLDWAEKIGALPPAWNHPVMYADPNQADFARVLHYTAGIPCWTETSNTPEAKYWKEELKQAMHTVPWFELMGNSTHAPLVLASMMRKYGVELQVRGANDDKVH